MTSSLRWIVVRSLHSLFSTYLLPSILWIIPSFLLVFKIGSVLMVCLLIGSHLIFHFALRQSQSMIPSLHSLLFPVVYPKVPYTPLQNCFPSLGSFPSLLTVYPDFDSCYPHFMPYRMTPSVRHRAIEVHYYYYFIII